MIWTKWWSSSFNWIAKSKLLLFFIFIGHCDSIRARAVWKTLWSWNNNTRGRRRGGCKCFFIYSILSRLIFNRLFKSFYFLQLNVLLSTICGWRSWRKLTHNFRFFYYIFTIYLSKAGCLLILLQLLPFNERLVSENI